MSIVETLYDSLDAKAIREAKNPRKRNGFWASAVGKCKRQTYYWHTGIAEPEPMAGATYLKMLSGTIWHNELRKLLAEAYLGIKFASDPIEERAERTFKKVLSNGHVTETTIVGKADGLHVGKTLIEIKSFGAWQFDKFRAAKDPLDYLRHEYIDYFLQCQLMAGLLGADNIALIPINRDTGVVGFRPKFSRGKFTELNFPFSQKAFDYSVERAFDLQRALNEMDMPDREYKQTDWQCKYCPFKKDCWVNEGVATEAEEEEEIAV